MIISSQVVEGRIKEACLLQTEKHRIGAIVGAKAARAQPLVRLARIFILIGRATSKRRLPPRSNTRSMFPGCEISQRGIGSRKVSKPFVRCSSAVGLGLDQTLGSATFAVALSEARPSAEIRRCYKSGAPQH